MANIDNILLKIEPEMNELNGSIRTFLESESAMMNAIVSRYLQAKGKQLRPMLALLSARLLGEVNANVLCAGAAVEMLHNATLIHDDVIDRSDTRRGRPTINSVWDNHIAVLAGDFFLSKALVCSASTGDLQIMNVLSGLGAELSVGEIEQADNAQQHSITEESYMNIISYKTAALFTACVEVGALAAGADPEKLGPIKKFAHLLGQAFQIKDDTFDYFDDPTVGKPTGNDLLEGKVTLPLIYALRQGSAQAAEMATLLRQPALSPEEVATLVEFAKQNGGIEYSHEVMSRMRDEAFLCLGSYGDSPATADLKEVFTYIINREK